MTLTITQLLPLAVTFFALAMAAPSLNPSPTRVQRHFIALNLAVFLWSFGDFMQFSTGNTTLDPRVMEFGTHPHIWLLITVIGIAAAPTAWLHFTVEYAGIRKDLSTTVLRLTYAPLVVGIVFGLLNPWTQLAARLNPETGLVETPPVALAFTALLAVPMAIGAYVLVRYTLRRDRTERAFAHLLALASFLPTLSLVLWGVRDALGLSLSFDAAPLMLLVFDGMVGLLIYVQRFAEIIPRATLEAFEHIRDSALIMNRRGLILAMNASARHAMNDVATGDFLSEARPALASKIQECFEMAAEPEFEVRMQDRIYRVRPRKPDRSPGSPAQCVVLLSDMTDIREAQNKLQRLHGDRPIPLRSRPLRR